MRWPSVVVAAAFAALTYAFWGFVNQPTAEPAWPSKIQGFAFSPYQADQDATLEQMPTVAQLESDLKLLSGKTNAVRTYSALGTFADIPALADKHDLNVTVGTWIDTRLGRNLTAIEVKSGRSRDALPGLAAFSEAFRPQRKLLVGADGIPVEEFLLQPVEHWVKA